MKDVTVKKEDLLKILRENRDKHVEIFHEACDGYKTQAEKILQNHLERVRKGRMNDVIVSLPAPTNHTKDYERVIKMVEMDQGEVITLTEADVSQYVMDDWAWKRQFLTSNSHYSASASSELEDLS